MEAQAKRQGTARLNLLRKIPSVNLKKNTGKNAAVAKLSLILWINMCLCSSVYINPGKKIRFPNRKERLNDLLLYLSKKYGLSNKIIGDHIILYYSSTQHKGVIPSSKKLKEPVGSEAPIDAGRKPVSQPIKKSEHPQPPSLLLIHNRRSSIPSPVHLPRIGNIAFNPGKALKAKTMEAIPMLDEKPGMLPLILSNPSGVKESKNVPVAGEDHRLHISAGMTESEVQYINPQIKAGFSWFFLSAEWRTNFKVAGFFYGLGIYRDISPDWGLQVSATSGMLSKSYKQFPLSDTSIRVKTRLTAINFLARRHFKKRWTLQFGPVLNFMRGKHVDNGLSVRTISLPDNLSPPYTIVSNYNKKTNSAKKLWVGLQIGLFYRLW